MKLSSSFDTSINRLLALQNDNTHFLSTWNKGNDHLEFSDAVIWPAVKQYAKLKNEYFFSDEFSEFKRSLVFDKVLPISESELDYIGIFSNGTSAAMLALMSIKEVVSSIRAILIAPTYFTYIKILQDLDSDIYYFPIKIEESLAELPIDNIKECIARCKVNLVVLTIPLFGSGLSPAKERIEELCSICENAHCYLLIDYLYGGMEWFKHNTIENEWLWGLCLKNTYIIFIESMSKRVFLNGIKSAIAGASIDLIQQMELKSVHLAGSLSYVQVEILQELYSGRNTAFIENTIERNIGYFRGNFELLKTLCRGTPVQVLPCTEGYFCLAEILNESDDDSMETAIRILKQSNVMTIPHDRYLYFTPQKYTFRINLSVQKEVLLGGMKALLQLYF